MAAFGNDKFVDEWQHLGRFETGRFAAHARRSVFGQVERIGEGRNGAGWWLAVIRVSSDISKEADEIIRNANDAKRARARADDDDRSARVSPLHFAIY
jgi:hypothetical protein